MLFNMLITTVHISKVCSAFPRDRRQFLCWIIQFYTYGEYSFTNMSYMTFVGASIICSSSGGGGTSSNGHFFHTDHIAVAVVVAVAVVAVLAAVGWG